ncbi:hypothetical protein [Brucella anthropi]|uniref:hypothetical protein n=1 Tax=Brucella anthropi TaxID=529 RepID=UPI0005B7E366|nr:hypothetical protein [Brucella anthropi]KIU69113.1 hypothetical protein TR92_07500 [Brucella anthropi]
MMNVGFLKDVNGIKRMRMVKPGYDANDYNIPINAVIFDSVMPSHLSIFDSGIATISAAGNPLQVVSWPDPGYVPMTIVAMKSASGEAWYSVVPFTGSGNSVLGFVTRTGLFFYTGALIPPVHVAYFAFRSGN